MGKGKPKANLGGMGARASAEEIRRAVSGIAVPPSGAGRSTVSFRVSERLKADAVAYAREHDINLSTLMVQCLRQRLYGES